MPYGATRSGMPPIGGLARGEAQVLCKLACETLISLKLPLVAGIGNKKTLNKHSRTRPFYISCLC